MPSSLRCALCLEQQLRDTDKHVEQVVSPGKARRREKPALDKTYNTVNVGAAKHWLGLRDVTLSNPFIFVGGFSNAHLNAE